MGCAPVRSQWLRALHHAVGVRTPKLPHLPSARAYRGHKLRPQVLVFVLPALILVLVLVSNLLLFKLCGSAAPAGCVRKEWARHCRGVQPPRSLCDRYGTKPAALITKLRTILDADESPEGARIIVFSQWDHCLAHVHAAFEEAGLSTILLSRVAGVKREKMLERFRCDPKFASCCSAARRTPAVPTCSAPTTLSSWSRRA